MMREKSARGKITARSFATAEKKKGLHKGGAESVYKTEVMYTDARDKQRFMIFVILISRSSALDKYHRKRINVRANVLAI